MNLSQSAVKHSRLIIVFILSLLIWGSYAYFQLARDVAPHFSLRTIQIVTQLPHSTPRQVENFVSKPLEQLLQKMPIVDYVTSESSNNMSLVSVHLKPKVSSHRLWQELHFSMAEVRHLLPDNVVGPFIHDEGDLFGIVLGVTAEGFSTQEVQNITQEIQQHLQLLTEVNAVKIYGEQKPAILVEYDPKQLAHWQLSPQDISQALQQQQIEFDDLSLDIAQEKVKLEIRQPDTAIEALQNIIIPTPKRSIFLHQVANISQTFSLNDLQVHASGKAATVLAVSMRQDGNLTKISHQVRELLQDLKASYPIGLDFQMITCQPKEVEQVLDKYLQPLGISLLVVAVLFVLFLGLRMGLIVSLLIPLTFSVIFIGLWLFGLQLDKITIIALFLSLIPITYHGVVIADAMNIAIQQGEDPISALDTLQNPTAIGALVVASLFMPVLLGESATLEYISPLLIVILLGLFGSYILVLTVVPLLVTRFIDITGLPHKVQFDTYYHEQYQRILFSFLHHRRLTILLAVLSVAAIFYSAQFLASGFLPASQCPYFKVELELPPTTPLEKTSKIVQEIEGFLQTHQLPTDEKKNLVKHWVSYIGGGGPRFILQHIPQSTRSNHALLVIHVDNENIIDSFAAKLENFVYSRFPDVGMRIQKIPHGVPVQHPVEIRLTSNDEKLLLRISQATADKLAKLAGTKNVVTDWGNKVKKLLIKPDAQRMQQFGVTHQALVTALQGGFAGIDLAQYQTTQQRISVVLHEKAERLKNIKRLENLLVYAETVQEYVRLKQVADVELAWEYPKRVRRNGWYTVTVGADVQHYTHAFSVERNMYEWLRQQDWHGRYQYHFGGQYELAIKSYQATQPYIALSGFIILALLAFQFNSLRNLTVALIAVPFMSIGVLAGLWAVNGAIDLMFVLGCVILAAFSIQQSMLWLTRKLPNANKYELLLTSAQYHFRAMSPVIIISLFALLPMWLIDCPLLKSLLAALTFGLLFLPVVSFIILPVLYGLLFGLSFKDYSNSSQNKLKKALSNNEL
ncbi:efflux RND transporter permease subunit [Candidatus Albibeggiatoa sp. nov. NOAA]|uniref:efflux RND transporter permease subunit n=1 Tax=Candidatus Albibeggiatoa sp. nov. NOAA TaxID=3162724 RepID=UPI003302B00C|nr:efflux RND transporter permease subunit [Thiotrichaceae bacterium]